MNILQNQYEIIIFDNCKHPFIYLFIFFIGVFIFIKFHVLPFSYRGSIQKFCAAVASTMVQ